MKNLSIVIITLNEELVIKRLLNNLLNQTYKNFEVIIVDSNSNDNTQKYATEFKNKFQEFEFIKMQNRGVSLGRNTGAKHAKYNDILFLDADTDIEETFIEELITQISKYCIDVGTMKFKSRSKNFRYKIGTFLANTFMKGTSFVSPTGVGACMYSKKDVFNNIEGFDERITLCEDCDYFNRAQKKGYKFKVIPLYFYFDMRRLEQDGIYKTFFKYLHANIYRFTKRELINDERFDYKFGHYKK